MLLDINKFADGIKALAEENKILKEENKMLKESSDAVQTDLVQRSDVLEVISDAQDGSGSTYNILQPIFVKVNNLPSCHRCDECDEQFYQQLLEKGMIELPQEYVSVVRCKDCRHRDLFSCPLADNDFQKDDDYCSWGERSKQ